MTDEGPTEECIAGAVRNDALDAREDLALGFAEREGHGPHGSSATARRQAKAGRRVVAGAGTCVAGWGTRARQSSVGDPDARQRSGGPRRCHWVRSVASSVTHWVVITSQASVPSPRPTGCGRPGRLRRPPPRRRRTRRCRVSARSQNRTSANHAFVVFVLGKQSDRRLLLRAVEPTGLFVAESGPGVPVVAHVGAHRRGFDVDERAIDPQLEVGACRRQPNDEPG